MGQPSGTILGEALTGIRRNGLMSLAAVTTVAISLFILSIFLLVAVNVDNFAGTIESQIEVRVYLADGLDQAAIDDLTAQAQGIDGVTTCRFVSKTEALASLRQELGPDSDLLEGVDEMNPLRDSLILQTEGPAWVDSVATAAQSLPGVEEVGYTHDLVQRVLNLTRALRAGGLGLVVLLILATLFVISNTVRLTILARSEEVAIMRLVGATNWFIRWPFLFEGVFLGLAGAVLASLGAWQGYSWAVGGIYTNIPFIPVVPVYPLVWRMGLLTAVLGVFIGGLGSALSLRRFLRA